MKLEARNVTKLFGSRRARATGHGVVAVKNASMTVEPGDFVAIVGESGSGKSTLARILLQLIEPSEGEVLLDGKDVAKMNRAEMRDFRTAVQCVLQDPSGSLNPRKTVGTLLAEVIRFHKMAKGSKAVEDLVIESLNRVGLKPERRYMERYPHELSGGQRQRVLLARALVLRPRIIIADEAVSALDVSVKAGVLRLMNELREDLGVGYALITHDLPVVRKVATYVYVMRRGEIVEEGPTEQLFESPQHEYTKTLLAAAPDLDKALAR